MKTFFNLQVGNVIEHKRNKKRFVVTGKCQRYFMPLKANAKYPELMDCYEVEMLEDYAIEGEERKWFAIHPERWNII